MKQDMKDPYWTTHYDEWLKEHAKTSAEKPPMEVTLAFAFGFEKGVEAMKARMNEDRTNEAQGCQS